MSERWSALPDVLPDICKACNNLHPSILGNSCKVGQSDPRRCHRQDPRHERSRMLNIEYVENGGIKLTVGGDL